MNCTWTIVTCVLLCLAIGAPDVMAEESDVPSWEHGDAYEDYRDKLLSAGFQVIVPRNRGNATTTPEGVEPVEAVTAVLPDGTELVVLPGTMHTVPSNSEFLVWVARVPFPGDEHANEKMIQEVEDYLETKGLDLGNCYDEDGIVIPKAVAKERYKGLEFRKPSTPPSDLKVGDLVHVIVVAMEPGGRRGGTRRGDSRPGGDPVLKALEDVVAAQKQLTLAIEALTKALSTGGKQTPSGPGTTEKPSAPKRPAEPMVEKRLSSLEAKIQLIDLQLRAVRGQIESLTKALKKKQDA